MPKYSIVVSIYNIQDYVRQCVDSILNQTIKDFELILVDDGSKDDSGKICDEYTKIDNRVKVLHKENGGLSDARNAGLLSSKGEYVYFVDGDDWLLENTIEEFDNILKQYGNVDFIHGRYTVCYTQTGTYKLCPSYIDNEWAIEKSGQEVFALAYKKGFPIAMGIRGVYKKEFLINNNLFFEKGLYAEDEEWTPRLFLKANTLCGCKEGRYIYRANRTGSLMNTLNVKKFIDLIQIYDKWFELVKENCSEYFKEALISEAYKRAWSAFVYAAKSLRKKDFNKFATRFKELVKNWIVPSKDAGTDKFLVRAAGRMPNLGYVLLRTMHILKIRNRKN